MSEKKGRIKHQKIYQNKTPENVPDKIRQNKKGRFFLIDQNIQKLISGNNH